ncbi:MAG: HNH endonuclease [Sedimentibacter sp.]|uniref:HNH endonuclease n=1 Tax=Sedimentibacter sp. TaxID=1960295 RepID=UPI002980FA33|nr:HNH endonuclease [Sedimentibacter sp.]MDW5300143.1 HNH endonuclease [Sedimentibacter sp.]
MTILEKIKDTFKDCQIGTEFTTQEIINKAVLKHGCNPGSVIPSDYCYNRINNGIDFENYLHLFEYMGNKTYKFLGENYPYNGTIFHKPKGGFEIAIGKWSNGVIHYESYDGLQIKEEKIKDTDKKSIKHRTKRDASVKLRFDVFKRDNFKCCICGASPAKDQSVELHIDHIIPWSKGGETEINNLQTLCSRCNLGKSDYM